MPGFSWEGALVGAADAAQGIARKWIDVEQQTELAAQLAEIQMAKEQSMVLFKQQVQEDREGRIASIIKGSQDPEADPEENAGYARDALRNEGMLPESDVVNKQYDGDADRRIREEDLDLRTENTQLQREAQATDRQERMDYRRDVLEERKRHNRENERLGATRAAGSGRSGGSKSGGAGLRDWQDAYSMVKQYTMIDKQPNLDAANFAQQELMRLRDQGMDPMKAASTVGNKLNTLRSQATASGGDDINSAFSSQIQAIQKFRQQKLQQQQPQGQPPAQPGQPPQKKPGLLQSGGATGKW